MLQLKGQELITQIDNIRNDVANVARVIPMSEFVLSCGYVRENGKPDFIAFYTELLEAKGLLNDDNEDGEVSEIETELVERYGQGAVDAFIEVWSADDLEHFEDAYQGEMSGADFARQLVEDCYGLDVPAFVDIDWSATWDNLNGCDYYEQDGFIFSSNW